MIALTSLWLPIVASAVAVFFLSFLMWMVLPHHIKDHAALPDEGGLIESLRKQGAKPGLYGFPHCTRESMKDPEWIRKRNAGPAGFLVVMGPGSCNMGAALGKWMILLLAIFTVTAYVAGIALPPGAESLTVFRFTASCVLLAFCSNLFSDAIWKGLPLRGVLTHAFDGVAYALVAGGIFGWLWPAAGLPA